MAKRHSYKKKGDKLNKWKTNRLPQQQSQPQQAKGREGTSIIINKNRNDSSAAPWSQNSPFPCAAAVSSRRGGSGCSLFPVTCLYTRGFFCIILFFLLICRVLRRCGEQVEFWQSVQFLKRRTEARATSRNVHKRLYGSVCPLDFMPMFLLSCVFFCSEPPLVPSVLLPLSFPAFT